MAAVHGASRVLGGGSEVVQRESLIGSCMYPSFMKKSMLRGSRVHRVVCNYFINKTINNWKTITWTLLRAEAKFEAAEKRRPAAAAATSGFVHTHFVT
jgi:hypothetical protein